MNERTGSITHPAADIYSRNSEYMNIINAKLIESSEAMQSNEGKLRNVPVE
jgi:hypothetical protein